MDVITGALPSVITKLADLVAGEYNLQKELKGGIKFLQQELESMKGALEDISKTPAYQLPIRDKIWARNVRDLSYDIEDNVDKFMVQYKGKRVDKQNGLKKVIDKSLDLLMQPKIRHKIATEIREIKSRVIEVHERRSRYDVSLCVDKPVIVDPRIFTQYTEVKDLVGIDEARDELISKIMIEENEVPMKQGKIVSIVGFGGLGKTTLANEVYEKIRARFDCCAFVSVSQTPDLTKLYKGLLYGLGNKEINDETLDETRLIDIIRQFLQKKSYFIVIDDIWDLSDWEIIRCALPHNDCGYRIITTTRILSVATGVGDAYLLKPLSLHNSRILFYKRVFGHEKEANCLDDELAEVSDKILKKCAGVPMAIITIASLLASKGKNKMEWYNVYRSLGAGLDNSLDVENMRMILLCSYYDLPPHLRACLLYLSVFPEHYVVEKDRLIRLWIGEGFIQCKRPWESLFQVGESYFNELINKSMIQPVYGWNSTVIEFCRVHSMMLDLICSLSYEENFVTIFSTKHYTSPTEKVRRLSLQTSNADNVLIKKSNADHDIPGATMTSMQLARSVVVFPYAVDEMPALQRFRILRILDLEGCLLSQDYNFEYLGKLIHLRYLGLKDTHITRLPEEIGNLQCLQVMDVRGNMISSLPSTVAHLKDLVCLLIGSWTRTPDGIGNLSSLEELSTLCISDSPNTVQELSHLTELRVLSVDCRILWKDDLDNSLVECLQKLQKLERLSISAFGECNLETWVVPHHLRRLELTGCWSSTLSSWMNPTLLLELSILTIEVMKLQQEDLEILGRLPALTYLDLEVNHENLGIVGRLIIGASSFPCLVKFVLRGSIRPVAFQQGAMPRLESLCFTFTVLKMREISNCDGNFDLGMRNLQSLRNVNVSFLYGGASEQEVEEAEAALRNEIAMHHNNPSLEIH